MYSISEEEGVTRFWAANNLVMPKLLDVIRDNKIVNLVEVIQGVAYISTNVLLSGDDTIADAWVKTIINFHPAVNYYRAQINNSQITVEEISDFANQISIMLGKHHYYNTKIERDILPPGRQMSHGRIIERACACIISAVERMRESNHQTKSVGNTMLTNKTIPKYINTASEQIKESVNDLPIMLRRLVDRPIVVRVFRSIDGELRNALKVECCEPSGENSRIIKPYISSILAMALNSFKDDPSKNSVFILVVEDFFSDLTIEEIEEGELEELGVVFQSTRQKNIINRRFNAGANNENPYSSHLNHHKTISTIVGTYFEKVLESPSINPALLLGLPQAMSENVEVVTCIENTINAVDGKIIVDMDDMFNVNKSEIFGIPTKLKRYTLDIVGMIKADDSVLTDTFEVKDGFNFAEMYCLYLLSLWANCCLKSFNDKISQVMHEQRLQENLFENADEKIGDSYEVVIEQYRRLHSTLKELV